MYQNSLVQFLTQIVAKSPDLGQLIYMLDPNSQFDNSNILTKFVKMKEPKIAQLQDGRFLTGWESDISTILVFGGLMGVWGLCQTPPSIMDSLLY